MKEICITYEELSIIVSKCTFDDRTYLDLECLEDEILKLFTEDR